MLNADSSCRGVFLSSLLGAALLVMGAPSSAQTDADILVNTVNPVGAFIEAESAHIPRMIITTPSDGTLVASVGAGGVTLYSDGDIGIVRYVFNPGQMVGDVGELGDPFRGVAGSITTERTVLTAVTAGSPQVSGTILVTNGGIGTTFGHATVNGLSVAFSPN